METLARQGTTAEPDQGTEGISSKCGVECMSNRYDEKLWQVLKKRKMADLEQFHQSGHFDEAPLYTRETDIEFLQDDENANEILLRFALRFLNRVIAFKTHERGYFAAITLWSYSEDLLVPNVFFWCRPVESLDEKLTLRTTATSFGKRIKSMVPKLGLSERFKVLEDVKTEPDSARVFIGPTFRSYSNFVTLDHFQYPSVSVKS